MHADFIVNFTRNHPTRRPNDPRPPASEEIRVHLALSPCHIRGKNPSFYRCNRNPRQLEANPGSR
jgi:hypothetical protein